MIFYSVIIAVTVSTAFDIPLDSIVARNSKPIAPRGGALMIQLLSETLSDNWPATIEVQFDNGESVTGYIGWIEKNPNNVSWTSNPSIIRPILPTDNTQNVHPKDRTSGPVLLVMTPRECSGSVSFAGDSINPTWIDLPEIFPNMNITPVNKNLKLIPEERDDTPEWNPQEYWRWALVASRKGLLPPEPPNESEIDRLAALQGEHIWRIGFDRLVRSSRGVAADSRDLLTNTTLDGTHSYASWIVKTDSLRSLLSILLDQSTTSRQLVIRTLRWVEDQQPHIHWLETVFGSTVTLAIANPTLEPALATMKWENERGVPIAVEVPANQTKRCELERELELDLSIFGPEVSTQTESLLISIGNRNTSLQVVSQQVKASPPFVQLATLYPLWNLQSVQNGVPKGVNPSNATSVQVRKLLGRWELFIQCAGISEGNPLPETIENLSSLRGTEAVTILHPESDTTISISPTGLSTDSQIPQDLSIHKAVHERGWNIRVELPNSWIVDDALSFSIVRTHGDSDNVETGPLPCIPWNIKPSPIVIDLSRWDDIERFPTQRPMH